MRKEYYLAHKEEVLSKNKAYRQRNWVRVQEVRKQWKLKNKELLIQKRKAHYLIHKDRLLETCRNYRLKNKSKIKEWQKEYSKNHPEVGAKTCAKRRFIKSVSRCDNKLIRSWMRQIKSNPFARCHWCGTKVSGNNIHFDHVIALANGGTHSIGNLCAACSECNHRKSARAIADWVVGGQTFLSL